MSGAARSEGAPRWVLPAQISAVVLAAAACLALSLWTFFAVRPSAGPQEHRVPVWIVSAWDATTERVGSAFDGSLGSEP